MAGRYWDGALNACQALYRLKREKRILEISELLQKEFIK
jgi:hypothetical protein